MSRNGQRFCHAPWTVKIMAGDGDACRRTASAAERNHDSRRAVKMSTMALDLVILFLKRKIKLRRARYSGVRAILKSGAFFINHASSRTKRLLLFFFSFADA